MESVTTRFSHQPNKASATFSKKITTNLYDDVYGAPPRFASSSASISPRFEDYGEIFSSFHAARASSIPVLDLPPVDGAGSFFDSGIAGFDYAEVFRGFSGLDFWTSHEDLFRRDGFSDEEEAWTQVETDSFSEDLEHVVNNQGISDIDFFQSVNGGREFNVSYHKVSGTRSEDTSKGKTHTAQLHAVPGFSHVVEETTRFLRTDPSLQVVDDTELDVERNAGKAKGNRLRKSMSRRPGNLTSGEGEQVLGSDLDMHDGCRRNGSHSSETFVAVSDISLRTIPSELPPPSRPPPVLDASRGHSSGFHSKSERVDDGETLGYSSPPFYDVEVDINSSSAAMKNAMHRPAAKLKNAEEFRGRKKGASETNTKSSYHVKNDEAKISEITRFDSLNDDRKQESCDFRSGKMKISATDESQKATKVAPETSEPLERERLVNMFEEKHIKESRSSLESDRSTAVGTWKEETEFFELVGTEEHGKVIRPINHTMSLMQDTKTYEHGRKVGEAPNIQEEYKNVKAIAEGYQVEDKKKSKAAKMALEQGKSIRKSKSSNEKYRQRENVKNDKMTEFFELQKNEKKTRTVHQHGKTGNIVTKADQSDSLREIAETQHKEHQKVESAKSKEVDRQTPIEVQCSMDHKDNEKKLKEDEDKQLSVKRQKQKQSQKMKENGKIVREAFALGTAEGEEIVKDSENLDRIDERVNEPLKIDRPEEKTTCKRENEIIFKQAKQIKSKKGLKEAYESKTIEKSLEGSFKKEESDQGLKYDLGKIENEMGLEEDFELELSKKSTTEVFYQEGNEQYERDQAKEKCREVFNEYGKGNILKEAGHGEKIQKVQKQAPELERNVGNEAQRKTEIESPSNPAFDREGSVDISNEDSHTEKSEKMLKDTGSEKDKGLDKDLEQIQADGEGVDMEFSKEINETLETEYDESLLAAHSSSIHEEKMGKLEASEEPIADPENGKARTDCKVDEKKLEEIGVENLLANVRKQASEISLREVEHSGTQSGRVDHKMTNADGLGFCSEKTCTEKTNIVSPMEFGPDSQERKLAHEWGERGNIKQHANAGLNHEQKREQESSIQANPCGDDRRNTVADAPGIVPKAASVQNSCQRSYVAHSTKSKDKSLDETPAAVEKDAERTRREVELEKDRLRKIEEEIERERERHKDRMAVNRAMLEAEREREREKDRMAVDRATLEARDRAYTEARERAERAAFERATAEARQRALGEARERLEKACAEARDKSFADKAAAEAKLKAERAAVERATAEARERAMEKVKVERAVFESRERLERSVSEKFGVSFRNDGRQGSSSSGMLDPHVQNFNSSTGSRYPYSSVYGASSFSERSGGEGETAQRCRARLERYQRTAERAAKALEEKNTRDLIAQREQAERNRLAETLDAEVRRWSSGKEGNLRALLSTLQYILGHDSGWQPIPLTEVITSAAVKKAYRKATLCVHPDKLQQRGASVQHKYTCEKVFDLLKEAWTKFNSEER